MQEQGQTLIETLITVLVLAAGALSLVSFQSHLSYESILAEQKAFALLLATEKIESLLDYQVLYTTPGYTAWQAIENGSASTIGNTTSYTITWTVTPYTAPTYKQITVTVSWVDIRGNSQSIQQNMHIAGIDPQTSAVIM